MTNECNTKDFFRNSALYREFLLEREEILKHKWLESEKVGHDIGFENALLDWIVKYRNQWRLTRGSRLSETRLSEKKQPQS
jgi:hypothetical protein